MGPELKKALDRVLSNAGTVSNYELRAHIGDRIPGAVSIVARSMGVEPAELIRMADDGELDASDLRAHLELDS
jgi:tape measure domain-containing protein